MPLKKWRAPRKMYTLPLDRMCKLCYDQLGSIVEYSTQVGIVEEAKNSRARQVVERMALTPAELQRLVAVLRVVLDTLDPDYRANVAAIARELGKSRRTVYHWADRVLEATAGELREIRVGRPSKRGRTGSG